MSFERAKCVLILISPYRGKEDIHTYYIERGTGILEGLLIYIWERALRTRAKENYNDLDLWAIGFIILCVWIRVISHFNLRRLDERESPKRNIEGRPPILKLRIWIEMIADGKVM